MLDHRTILAATDLSACGDTAVTMAAELARKLGSTRLHVLHVVKAPGFLSQLAAEDALATGTRAKAAAEQSLESKQISAGEVQVTREVVMGIPAREVTLRATALEAGLIVVGTNGSGGIKRTVLGSVAQDLVRVAAVPVLVVGKKPEGPVHRVMAAIDLSPISQDVLECAVAIARPFEAEVIALTILEEASGLFKTAQKEEETHLRELLAQLIDRVAHEGTRITPQLVTSSSARDALLEMFRRDRADLVVLGTSGQRAWRRMLLGSAAQTTLSQAPCSVLIVPARESRWH